MLMFIVGAVFMVWVVYLRHKEKMAKIKAKEKIKAAKYKNKSIKSLAKALGSAFKSKDKKELQNKKINRILGKLLKRAENSVEDVFPLEKGTTVCQKKSNPPAHNEKVEKE